MPGGAGSLRSRLKGKAYKLWRMFRKDLIPLLLERPLTVPQIARLVGEKPKDVAEDLQHLLRSLKHTEYEAWVQPAECRKCDFEFSASKLTKPSKCPNCGSSWIAAPLIALREKNSAETSDAPPADAADDRETNG